MSFLLKLTAEMLEITLGVSLVILILLLLSPLLKQRYVAKWRYWVWLVLAVRLLVPVNFSLAQAPVRIEPLAQFDQYVQSDQLAPVNAPAGADVLPAGGPASPGNSITPDTNRAPGSPVTENRAMKVIWNVIGLLTTLPALWPVIWPAGISLFILWQLAAYGRFHRFVQRWSRPVVTPEAQVILAKLLAELKISSPVQLRVCPPIGSPLLIGFFRPLILLPQENYPEDEWFFILKHELIHQQRHDIGYKMLMLAANMIHWFNPLVWLMARRANKDLEISCDDAVIAGLNREERGRYSETIMAVVRNKPLPTTALSTYFFGGARVVKERLLNIFDMRKKRRGLPALLTLVICLGAAGALVACNAGEGKPDNGVGSAQPDIQVTVLLQDLTAEEYLRVGTAEIPNPSIDDFKKLTLRLDTRGLSNRRISFPGFRDMQELLTSDVFWFGSSESRDNPAEDDAYYLLETTLYTHNTPLEELRGKLNSLAIGVVYTDQEGGKVENAYKPGDYLTVEGSGIPKEAKLKADEELNSLVAAKFPETAVRQKGVLLLTKLIPRSVVPQDDLLLALVRSEAKMGQSGATLLVLDKDLNIIESSEGDLPLSPCYTAQTFRTGGYTITFGCTDNTKWLGDSDQVVPVDLQKVRVRYDNGNELWSPVQNNSYICWVRGTPDLVGLYFYNDKNELQADYREVWGWGLGRLGLENYVLSPENVVKSYLEALQNNDYEAWQAALWPALKNEQNFTPALEKPGDLGVLSLSIGKIAVDQEETKRDQVRYSGSELAQHYSWSDDYIAENMIVVSARYTVDYDNSKVPYLEGDLTKNFILIREYKGAPWLIWDISGRVSD